MQLNRKICVRKRSLFISPVIYLRVSCWRYGNLQRDYFPQKRQAAETWVYGAQKRCRISPEQCSSILGDPCASTICYSSFIATGRLPSSARRVHPFGGVAASAQSATPTTATSTSSPVNISQQHNQPEVVSHETTTFKVRVNQVLLRVVVRDKQGKAVGNLARESFQVLDNGKPQLITSFSL